MTDRMKDPNAKYNRNAVILPNGKRVNIHGVLQSINHVHANNTVYWVDGYVYVSGHRVYGLADTWDFNAVAFLLFKPRGKHSHLVLV